MPVELNFHADGKKVSCLWRLDSFRNIYKLGYGK